MSAKVKGTRNKHKSRRLLETAGYAVTRAASSLGAWCRVRALRERVTEPMA